METIHVAYALDDNFTETTCVSMASMLFNTKNPIHFHVLENRLSGENKNILVSLKKKFPRGEWTFHTIPAFDHREFVVTFFFHTVETYFRLLLPEQLPELDKILYIDGDTVVDGDISELWKLELRGNLAGVAPESFQSHHKARKRLLGMDESDLYFNCGVMLLDLKKLRDFDLFNKARDVTARLYEAFLENGLPWYVDQEVLNHLFYKKCLFIPPKFNFTTHALKPLDCDGVRLDDWREAFLNPVVIHYIAEHKPFKITKRYMPCLLWERYYAYKAMTPYAAVEADDRRIAKYHQLQRQMDDALMIRSDHFNYFNLKKHALFLELGENLPAMSRGKKLALWGAGAYLRYLIAVLSTKDIYAAVLVDGEDFNQKKKIFQYNVENPETLKGKRDEYFVLLTMMNEGPAEKVGKLLMEYGYRENDYHHIFAPLWNSMNEEL